jgi:hypothetical protein
MSSLRGSNRRLELEQRGQNPLRKPPNHTVLQLKRRNHPVSAADSQFYRSMGRGMEQALELYPSGCSHFGVEGELRAALEVKDERLDGNGRKDTRPRYHRLQNSNEIASTQVNSDFFSGFPNRGIQELAIFGIPAPAR